MDAQVGFSWADLSNGKSAAEVSDDVLTVLKTFAMKELRCDQTV
jgi:hypothetical protein